MTKNPQLIELIEKTKERALTKESLPLANVANRIAAHLMRRCPDLCAVPGLWFSGSNVWPFLYDREPASDADIDVFILSPAVVTVENCFNDPRTDLCNRLGIPPDDMTLSKVKTGAFEDAYREGVKALYKGSKLDVWEGARTPQDTLRDYPHRTHSHCRAAFSFTDGLVVLPNEVAP